MIQLGETGSHFAASGSGSSNDYQRTGCFNIIIFTVTLIAYDERNIGRISGNGIMAVYLHSQRLQFFLISNGTGLPGKAGQTYTADIQTIATESIDQT